MQLTHQNYLDNQPNLSELGLNEQQLKTYQEVDKDFATLAKFYDEDEDIKFVIDNYLKAVNAALAEKKTKPKKANTKLTITKKEKPKKTPSHKAKTKAKPKPTPTKPKPTPKSKPKVAPKIQPATVEPKGKVVLTLDKEVQLAKRLVALNGKEVTKVKLQNFIKSIQKMLMERPKNRELAYKLQADTLTLLQGMGKENAIKINLKKETLDYYLNSVNQQTRSKATTHINRFRTAQGTMDREKALKIVEAIDKAIKSKRINTRSKEGKQVLKIRKELDNFLCNRNSGELPFIEMGLSGFNGFSGVLDFLKTAGILAIGANASLNLYDRIKSIKASDIENQTFEKIKLTGEYGNFIGQPEPGFWMMVSGQSGHGKSFWSIDFANYLAQKHGDVLYWAKEEGIGDKLKKKIKILGANSENLIFSEELPEELSPYKFLVIDSFTASKMTYEELEQLSHTYPKLSIIYLVTMTKEGDYKGSSDLKFESDMHFEAREGYMVALKNRYNELRKMKIKGMTYSPPGILNC